MIELDRIYNEDCLEGMKRIADGAVDCIITDLPYGVLNGGNKHTQWDCVIPHDKLWEQFLRVAKPNAAIVLFAQGMFAAQLMMSQPDLWRYNLIWHKDRATGFLNASKMPLRCHEGILVFYRSLPTYNAQMEELNGREPSHPQGYGIHKQTNQCYGNIHRIETYEPKDLTKKYPQSIIKCPKEHNDEQFHPTQKPVDLLRYLVLTYTNPNDVVLDATIGSGTTAIACIKEKRHYIGFELNKEYYDKAIRRIKAEQAQLTLF